MRTRQSRATCQNQGRRVHRRCGDGERDAWSSVRRFTTLQATGPHAFPQRFGIIGDLGQTYNSTATLRHLTKADPPVRCTLKRSSVHRGGRLFRPCARPLTRARELSTPSSEAQLWLVAPLGNRSQLLPWKEHMRVLEGA